MNILLSMLKKLPEYEALLSALEARQTVAVSGVSQIIRSHFISALIAESERPALIVCQDDLAAQRELSHALNQRRAAVARADETRRQRIKVVFRAAFERDQPTEKRLAGDGPET